MNSDTIKEWFLSHRRALPWREDPTPYRVWVSEVMLQQTQVAVVIPYFLKWMELFPTIRDLASAPLEKVLKVWEGLGYYSRARHLHEAANYLVARYGGELPRDCDQLAKIKGLGPYTQGAIRSFAFREKAAAVDGNVLRVAARYWGLEEPIDLPKTRRHITELVEKALPDEESWLVSEGLIELGATVCKKRPECSKCPLQSECLAFRHGQTDVLPKRSPRQKALVLHRYVAVIQAKEKVLVQKGEKGKVMADLYEFPYVEKNGPVKELFEEALQLPLRYCAPLPEQRHSFTRYRVHLYPHRFETHEEDPRFQWQAWEKLTALPFSSGHRRVLNELLPS